MLGGRRSFFVHCFYLVTEDTQVIVQVYAVSLCSTVFWCVLSSDAEVDLIDKSTISLSQF